MARRLSAPVGWIQKDSEDWWYELEAAVQYGILNRADEYARGGSGPLPTETEFRQANVALRKLRALAREVRKGQRDG